MALNMMNQVKIDEELFEACEKKDLNKVKTMLLCGGDPCSVVKGKEWAAIDEAVWNNDDDSTDILKAIMSSGTVKDINVRTLTRFGNTPLLTACIKGSVQCAKLLIENGADITAKNNFGDGVLNYAVIGRNLLMVKQCLKWNGVNVNEREHRNRTVLTWACEKGYVDIVRVLLSAGADVTLRDEDGYPPLWYARNNVKITNLFQNTHSNTEATSARPSSLPTAIGALSLSSSSATNQSITSVDIIIRRLFPKFDELKIRSTISTIQEAGVDFEDFDPQHLLVLEAKDFEKVLKPVEARLLLKAFRDEYSTEKRPVINF